MPMTPHWAGLASNGVGKMLLIGFHGVLTFFSVVMVAPVTAGTVAAIGSAAAEASFYPAAGPVWLRPHCLGSLAASHQVQRLRVRVSGCQLRTCRACGLRVGGCRDGDIGDTAF